MPKKPSGRPRIYSLAQRLRAKALFLASKSWREIEKDTGMRVDAMRNVARKEKWHLIRQSPVDRSAALDAIRDAVGEFNTTISAETQSLSFETLPLVRSALQRGSARDAKDSTAALKTLVEIARETSGIGEKDTAGHAPSIGLFFFNEPVQRARPLPEPAPVVEIARVEPVLTDVEFE